MTTQLRLNRSSEQVKMNKGKIIYYLSLRYASETEPTLIFGGNPEEVGSLYKAFKQETPKH